MFLCDFAVSNVAGNKVRMMNYASKMMDFCIYNDELCISNDEFCITNDELAKIGLSSRVGLDIEEGWPAGVLFYVHKR